MQRALDELDELDGIETENPGDNVLAQHIRSILAAPAAPAGGRQELIPLSLAEGAATQLAALVGALALWAIYAWRFD